MNECRVKYMNLETEYRAAQFELNVLKGKVMTVMRENEGLVQEVSMLTSKNKEIQNENLLNQQELKLKHQEISILEKHLPFEKENKPLNTLPWKKASSFKK